MRDKGNSCIGDYIEFKTKNLKNKKKMISQISFGIHVIESNYIDGILTVPAKERENNIKVCKLFDLIFSYSQSTLGDFCVQCHVLISFYSPVIYSVSLLQT